MFNFSEIFTILLWNISNLNSAKKSKNYFVRQKLKKKKKKKKKKKSLYYRNCISQTNFRRKFNFTVNIWEQNTETEKTNGFWLDMVNQNKLFSYKIKRQVINVFPRDVERTVE